MRFRAAGISFGALNIGEFSAGRRRSPQLEGFGERFMRCGRYHGVHDGFPSKRELEGEWTINLKRSGI